MTIHAEDDTESTFSMAATAFELPESVVGGLRMPAEGKSTDFDDDAEARDVQGSGTADVKKTVFRNGVEFERNADEFAEGTDA